MDVFKKALGRKLGPLPAWAWFLAAAFGWWFYQSRKSATATGPTPVQITPGIVTTPAPTGSGSGSGDGGGGGNPPPTGGPPPSGGPPPVQGIPIWLHGNPGHVIYYYGDPNVSGWFQSDGQWLYYEASPTPKYQGQAFTQNDPGLPPGAGQPPTNSQAPAGPGGQNTNVSRQPVPPSTQNLFRTAPTQPVLSAPERQPRQLVRQTSVAPTSPVVSLAPNVPLTTRSRSAGAPSPLPPRPRGGPVTAAPPVSRSSSKRQTVAAGEHVRAHETAQQRAHEQKKNPRKVSPPLRQRTH